MRLKAGNAALRVCLIATVGCLLVPSAASAARPRAWLGLPSHTTARKWVTIRYQLRNIPPGYTAELERHISGQGAHRWIDTAELFHSSGSVRWWALMGGRTVSFRVALFNAHSRFAGATSPRRLVIFRISAGAGGSTGGGFSSNASVSWDAPSTATAGGTLSFTYSSAGVPSGAQIALQQQEGTAHVWTTFGTTANTSGSWGINNMQMGQNEGFRLAVVRGSTVLATSSRDSVDVFGQVPLSTLLENWVNVGTFTTPSNTFPYVATASWVNFPGPYTDLQVSASDNDCNSVTFQFIEGDENSQDQNYIQGDTATASIIQQSVNAVSSSEPLNTPGSVTASLIPGQSWSLNLSEVAPGNNSTVEIFLNGYAMCDSTHSIIDNNSIS